MSNLLKTSGKKTLQRLLITLLLICVVAYTPSIAVADTLNAVQESGYVYDPQTESYFPVNDVTKEIKNITKTNPSDKVFEMKYEVSHDIAYRRATSMDYYLPTPGGVGYGMFYNSSFKNSFTTGTNLAFDILCPTKAGGNVSYYLYLTACNRASLGVEAFILYYGQNDFCFKVFDWAKPEDERWVVHIPYSEMSDYVRDKVVYNYTCPFVTIQNSTVQVGENLWKNSVLLYNETDDCYDLVYSYTYTATLAEQQDSFYGSWGPIVETFEDSYSNLNPMGFGPTFVGTKTSAYTESTWSAFEALSSSNSYIRDDDKGLELINLSPNHTFLVH